MNHWKEIAPSKPDESDPTEIVIKETYHLLSSFSD